ncbi:hypothetical protein QE152_g5726 [Popillia japonica]|uniref:Uncharacterized protein n=1 Tax=Popillia japonica TaxID=7064 RepID=A0AAW1MLU4_POPJA
MHVAVSLVILEGSSNILYIPNDSNKVTNSSDWFVISSRLTLKSPASVNTASGYKVKISFMASLKCPMNCAKLPKGDLYTAISIIFSSLK